MLYGMATLDGRPVSSDDLLTLALTNYGHFTSMRVEDDHRIRGLSLHMERLVRDCKIVWGTDLDTARVRNHVKQALDGHDGPCVVRVTVFDPAVNLGHPADADQPRALVTIRHIGAMPLSSLRTQSVRYERDLPDIKHTGLFGSLHARRVAQLNGFDDVLFVGADSRVSEGTTWNVGFIRDDGVVMWPKAAVLPGVTMALLQRHADHQVDTVTLGQAKGMQAAFATNTSIGVCPLSCIDDTPMAIEHPLLRRLRKTYLSIPAEAL
jgi:branched-subunit amino acid aminotransferase/4-amino-4-deoxychorismate lyase